MVRDEQVRTTDADLPRYPDLQGKVAVVTGAAQGIGEAFVFGLASQGARVIALDINREHLDSLAAEVASNYEVDARFSDISNIAGTRKVVDEIRAEYGAIDIWINNAGVYPRSSFLEASVEQWDSSLAVNLRGLFFASQSVAQVMRDGGSGGSIINLASIAGKKVIPNTSIYSVTKSGVEHLTRSMAIELAPFGVRVNAIAPGQIETSMTEWVRKDPNLANAALERIPLGRFGRVRDLVGAMLFLASETSSYTTGHTISVDGGVLHI